AITANLTQAALKGIAGLTLEATMDVGLNSATPAGTPALNWTTQVRFGRTGAFGAEVKVGTTTIAYTNDTFHPAAATATINAFDFVSGSGGFSYDKRLVDVNNGTSTLTDATLSLIEVTLTTARVGDPGGVGFSVAGGHLVLATISAPAVSYTALKGSLDTAVLERIDGFALSANTLPDSLNP